MPPTSWPSRSERRSGASDMQRTLDTWALLGLSGVLLVAFYYQFAMGELPCPLCALQRVGFIVAGVGLILNLRVGPANANYGLVLLTSVAAGSASLRQVALHVIPGTGHYGSALLGYHFYTWAFFGVGAMLLMAPAAPSRERMPRAGALTRVACWLFVALAVANAAAFLFECGVGPC